MLHDDARVVIVGASLAGLRTADALRAGGFAGSVTMVGEETHLPYDRPPLSKQFLSGDRTEEQLTFPSARRLADLGVELLLGQAATGLDHDRVHLGGESLPFTHLVVATGCRARRLPSLAPSPRTHTLRTLEDAQRLRAAMAGISSLLVVGSGFIAAEVAGVARAQGAEVTVVGGGPYLLPKLGRCVASWCTDLHREHGVRLALGHDVEDVAVTDEEVRVRVGGRTLAAEHAVIGVGALPNTEWLRETPLDVRDGVACDEQGRAHGMARVFAVGDVAAWWSRAHQRLLRVEHWTNAAEQAHSLAQLMLGSPPARQPHEVPYFWSDQHGLKVQVVGWTDRADAVQLVELTPPRGIALYTAGDRLVAAAAFGAPALLARLKPLVSAGAAPDAALRLVEALTTAPA